MHARLIQASTIMFGCVPTAVFADTLNFLFCAFLFFSCRLSIPCVSGTTLSPSEIAYLSDMYAGDSWRNEGVESKAGVHAAPARKHLMPERL
jgi:hypothetical protein